MNDNRYNEVWILKVGDNEWSLNKDQAAILKSAIKSGNRGMVVFDEFVVNIPFIKEFYLDRKVLKPEFQLPIPLSEEELRERELAELTPEQRAERENQRLKSWEDARKKSARLNNFIKDKSVYKPMSQRDFEKRRKELLEQAKNL